MKGELNVTSLRAATRDFKKNDTLKRFSLVLTRQGERKGSELTYFYGASLDDRGLIASVRTYLHVYLTSYTAMSFDDVASLVQGFRDSLSYDNYVITLKAC